MKQLHSQKASFVILHWTAFSSVLISTPDTAGISPSSLFFPGILAGGIKLTVPLVVYRKSWPHGLLSISD